LVKWAQRRNALFITIPQGTGQGRGSVTDQKVVFEPGGRIVISFDADARIGGGRHSYLMDVVLNKPINPEKSVWSLGVRGFDIIVEKAKLGMWPRLTRTTAKLPYVTIDWDRWQEDDDGLADPEEEGQDDEEEEEEPDPENDLFPGQQKSEL